MVVTYPTPPKVSCLLASMEPRFTPWLLRDVRIVEEYIDALQWSQGVNLGCYEQTRLPLPMTAPFNGAKVCTLVVTNIGSTTHQTVHSFNGAKV